MPDAVSEGMLERVVVVASVLACLTVPARADDASEIHTRAPRDTPERTSHALPLVETVAFELALNGASQLAGRDWADISLGSIRDNLTSSWVFDEDAFTIDQLAHPYGGAWPYLAARSSGHGFWVSSAYAFGGSLMWELLMETEPPSFNDQLTTTVGGVLLGESLHRIARALRYRPTTLREVAASALDPVGALNRATWGRAWRDRLPPSYYVHLGIGWEQLTRTLDGARREADQNQLHTELVLQHGRPGDAEFRPRAPLDHFDLHAAVDISREHVVGTLDVRGLLHGTVMERGSTRGLYGLYGMYDYMNPDRVRVSAIAVGPGIATETALGDRTFLRAAGVVGIVPWGAAGGSNESETHRDYHRGPGISEIVELELGHRRWGALRATARGWQIDGAATGDGREFVTTQTLAARLAVTANHAIGVEGMFSLRDSRFELTDARDQTFELRVFYALTSSD